MTKAKTFEVSVTRMPRVICAVCGVSVFYRPELVSGAWALAVHVAEVGHA